jgi:hypothetical protein
MPVEWLLNECSKHGLNAKWNPMLHGDRFLRSICLDTHLALTGCCSIRDATMNHTQSAENPPPLQNQESVPSITGLWGYVVRGESVAFFSPSFKRPRTARIVFQLRVVAGTPNSLSIWPR